MNTALLTIDDVASQNTPAIVDYLKEKGIRAIFFATGENVEKYWEQACYAVRSGMVVGNHSHTHPHFSTISLEDCVKEIEACEQVLERLYRECGVARRYRPFRFPYGDKGGANRDGVQRYLRGHGFDKVDDTHLQYLWWKENRLDTDVDTFWTFDFEEYRIRPGTGFTRESVWEKMHDKAPQAGARLFAGDNRHILLLHAHDETEEMLPGYYRLFIDHLLENGIVFDEPRFV